MYRINRNISGKAFLPTCFIGTRMKTDRLTNYLRKVMPERISDIRMASQYSIIMNRQDKRGLPKMHTLVVAMN